MSTICYCFDLDDTLIKTEAKTKVYRNKAFYTSLTSQQFSTFEKEPGDTFDFSDFDNGELILQSKKHKMWPLFKKINDLIRNNKIDGELFILTARSPIVRPYIYSLLRDNGIEIDMPHIFAVRTGEKDIDVGEEKRKVLELLSNKYQKVLFFDDDVRNVIMANSIKRVRAKLVEGVKHLSPMSKDEVKKGFAASLEDQQTNFLHELISKSKLFQYKKFTPTMKLQSFIKFVMGVDPHYRVTNSGKYFRGFSYNIHGFVSTLSKEEKLQLFDLIIDPNTKAKSWLKKMEKYEKESIHEAIKHLTPQSDENIKAAEDEIKEENLRLITYARRKLKYMQGYHKDDDSPWGSGRVHEERRRLRFYIKDLIKKIETPEERVKRKNREQKTWERRTTKAAEKSSKKDKETRAKLKTLTSKQVAINKLVDLQYFRRNSRGTGQWHKFTKEMDEIKSKWNLKSYDIRRQKEYNSEYDVNEAIKHLAPRSKKEIIGKKKGNKLITLASKTEDKDFKYELIKKGIKSNATNLGIGHNILLQRAAANGNYELVRLLLKSPYVDPADTTDDGIRYGIDESNWAIRRAAVNGQYEVVKLLLKDGRSDPTTRNNFALRHAFKGGHKDIVKLLLKDKRVVNSLRSQDLIKIMKLTESIKHLTPKTEKEVATAYAKMTYKEKVEDFIISYADKNVSFMGLYLPYRKMEELYKLVKEKNYQIKIVNWFYEDDRDSDDHTPVVSPEWMNKHIWPYTDIGWEDFYNEQNYDQGEFILVKPPK